MGVDNYTRWHRQQCQREDCMVCRTLASLDKQLDGLEEGAKFEDYHWESCMLDFCFYCNTYSTITDTADRANQELQDQGHIFSQWDQSGKIQVCRGDNCNTKVIKDHPDGVIRMEPAW